MDRRKLRRWSFGAVLLLGTLIAGVLTLGGCGGGYTDPASTITTTKTTALVDATTLKQWIDEGKLNAPFGSRDRVVIVSVTTAAAYGNAARGHIPGALLLDSTKELSSVREEGLGPVSGMMLTGPQVDTLVKKFGIDNNSTIVLTIPKGSSDSETYQMTVAYFTFRYWGFPRERLKILNGGDDAWDVAGLPLVTTATTVTPSTYTVKSNLALKDVVRYSVTEMISLVDAINKDATLLNTWQLLDARGYTTSPYLANALRTKDASGGTAHAMMYLGTRVNNETSRNRLFPDKATLLTRMATLPVINGAVETLLAPDKKTVVMCAGSVSASPTFFLFDAVLAVPEGNIMMYDGSSSQWAGYSQARIQDALVTALKPSSLPNATITAAINNWAFDVVTPNTSNLRIVGTLPTVNLNDLIPENMLYAPTQLEMNQIEEADRAYMIPSSGSTGTTAGSGGSSGGC